MKKKLRHFDKIVIFMQPICHIGYVNMSTLLPSYICSLMVIFLKLQWVFRKQRDRGEEITHELFLLCIFGMFGAVKRYFQKQILSEAEFFAMKKNSFSPLAVFWGNFAEKHQRVKKKVHFDRNFSVFQHKIVIRGMFNFCKKGRKTRKFLLLKYIQVQYAQ